MESRNLLERKKLDRTKKHDPQKRNPNHQSRAGAVVLHLSFLPVANIESLDYTCCGYVRLEEMKADWKKLKLPAKRLAVAFFLTLAVFASVSRAQAPVFEISHADSSIKFR
jgi:hypothetical protein